MPTATRNKSKTALARQFANNYPRKMSLIRRSVNLASPLKAPSASIACPLVSNSPLLTPLAFQARPLIEEASPGRAVDASSTSSEPVEEASRALAEWMRAETQKATTSVQDAPPAPWSLLPRTVVCPDRQKKNKGSLSFSRGAGGFALWVPPLLSF